MKKSRYTEDQAAYTLRLAESGTPVADVCRQMGISESTFHPWKEKCCSVGGTEVRELRQKRQENVRLKRLVADLTLDKKILQEVLRKEARASASPRAGAMDSRSLLGDPSTSLRARRHLPQHVVIPVAGARCVGAPVRIREIAQEGPRFGCTRMWVMLRREG